MSSFIKYTSNDLHGVHIMISTFVNCFLDLWPLMSIGCIVSLCLTCLPSDTHNRKVSIAFKMSSVTHGHINQDTLAIFKLLLSNINWASTMKFRKMTYIVIKLWYGIHTTSYGDRIYGPLMITRSTFSSILIICSTNKFESECAFIE